MSILDPCSSKRGSTINPLYSHALGEHFFCDTNKLQFKHVYIPYKPLQDCDYMQFLFIKQLFYAKIQVLHFLHGLF